MIDERLHAIDLSGAGTFEALGRPIGRVRSVESHDGAPTDWEQLDDRLQIRHLDRSPVDRPGRLSRRARPATGCADRVVLDADRRADRAGAAPRRRRTGVDRAARRRHLPRTGADTGGRHAPRARPRPHGHRRAREHGRHAGRGRDSSTAPCAAADNGSCGSRGGRSSSPSRTRSCSAATSTATSTSPPTTAASVPAMPGVVAEWVDRLVVSRVASPGCNGTSGSRSSEAPDTSSRAASSTSRVRDPAQRHDRCDRARQHASRPAGGASTWSDRGGTVVGNAIAHTMRAVDVDGGTLAEVTGNAVPTATAVASPSTARRASTSAGTAGSAAGSGCSGGT